jgi:hypothetical protein
LLKLRSLGLIAAVYGSEAFKDPRLLDDASAAAAAEGLNITALPGGHATYDAYAAIARAIAAGANTGDDIKARLAKLSPTGDIATATYEITTVKSGKFVNQ